MRYKTKSRMKGNPKVIRQLCLQRRKQNTSSQGAYQLSVEGGEEAIWGDDDRASREGLPILVQGVQVVSGGRGLGNGPAAQEHEDITISLDVGEEAGHPSVTPVKPHPGEQVAQQIRLCDGAVNV